MTKLTHFFELTKTNSDVPFIQMQMMVEFNPAIGIATAKTFMMYSHISAVMMDFTELMDRGFFKGIIENELAITDWKAKFLAQLHTENNLRQRIQDNLFHGIGDGPTHTFINHQQIIGSL